MEAFYICWTALLRESEKHGVSIWNSARKGFGAKHDHSIPVNRLEYVYLRGPLTINSVQECVLRSINDQTLPIYYKLADKDNCNICCLSRGPGLEVVGFLMGFRKHIHDFRSVSVTVINPLNEWHDISESLICENLYHPTNSTFDYYSPNSFDFICCDLKMLSFPARQCIQKADLIIMHKCCASFDSHALMMKDVTTLMKKDAVLFSINSIAKNRIFLHLQDTGTSLCSSIKIKIEKLPYDTRLASFVGLPPKTKGSLRLVVWQKHVSTLTSTKSPEVEFRNEIQSQGLDKQTGLDNSRDLNCGSEKYLIYEHSSLVSPICLQKLDLNSNNAPFSEPKSNSEIVENALYESNSSNFNCDISSSVSEISSETTVIKSSETGVLSTIEVSKYNVDSNTVPKSDKECETDLRYDSSESEGSKINAMLEHCEKMVDCLEKRIEDVILLYSCRNFCDNCCTYNSNHICHISPLALHQKCEHFNASIQNCCHDSNCCSQEVYTQQC